MAGQNQEAWIRRELDTSRITRDEQDVQNVLATITSIVNLFIVAEEAVASDLFGKSRRQKSFSTNLSQREHRVIL